MVFYVTAVTFLVALSLNKFTNTIISTYFKLIQMPIIETKFWHNLHPTKPMMKMV